MICKHTWARPRKDGSQHCSHCGIEYEQKLDDNEACNHPRWEFDDNIKYGSDITGQTMMCGRCGWVKVVKYNTPSKDAL